MSIIRHRFAFIWSIHITLFACLVNFSTFCHTIVRFVQEKEERKMILPHRADDKVAKTKMEIERIQSVWFESIWVVSNNTINFGMSNRFIVDVFILHFICVDNRSISEVLFLFLTSSARCARMLNIFFTELIISVGVIDIFTHCVSFDEPNWL